MGLASTIKRLVPKRVKQPLRSFVDDRAFRTQPRLDFDVACLRAAAEIDIPAIMNDPKIRDWFASDSTAISNVYGTGEISGGVNPGDRRAIYHLIAHFKPRTVLEIGTHVSASTVHIAAALRRAAGDSAKLTTADIIDVNGPSGAWSSLGMSKPPRELLATLGLGGITTFINRPALEVLSGSRTYDLIFLDGDHSPLAVYREIAAALRALNSPGLILLHDFYPDCRSLTPDGSVIKGPAKAAARVTAETNALEFIPLGNLPWPTKAGGNATSLALVAKAEQRA